MTSLRCLLALCGMLLALNGCSSVLTSPDESCISGTRWVGGNHENEQMNPGQACIACHSRGEGPRFAFAGTVYGTGAAHEVDNCFGTPSNALVRITGADGTVVTATTNAAGNFSINQSVALPYTAEVEANGMVRRMMATQTSGDCNGCHTRGSSQGRILAP